MFGPEGFAQIDRVAKIVPEHIEQRIPSRSVDVVRSRQDDAAVRMYSLHVYLHDEVRRGCALLLRAAMAGQQACFERRGHSAMRGVRINSLGWIAKPPKANLSAS
ncbi:MAG: hypothetical protein E5Y00_08890 [Mesorhizobium sp.]|nr:MAG: hypothetical protein E5Y00_08890 [Mesorhizobium sp.]